MTRRWLLGCAFFIAAALSVHPEAASWNVTSRLAAVESLVDRGTFAIEDSAFKTGDRYRYAGHFYSDKPIVPAIVGAALVEALRAVRIDVVANRQVLLAVLTIATVCVPFGISVAAFAGLLRALGSGEREAEAIAIVAGGATLAFPYATVLINHVPAFACLVVGLELLVRAAKRSAYLFVGGALFALAVGIDSSYVVFLVLAPIVIGRTSLRRHLLFAIGAAAVLAPLAASNVLLSGNVRPPDTNATLYDYPGSAFAHGYVLGSIGYRSAADLMRYAFSVTFGERGLFSYSPILAIAAYGLVRGLRAPRSVEMRRVLWFVTVASASYVVIVVLGTTDYGGDAYGLRRFVGIEMLMCLSLGAIWNELQSRRTERYAFLVILGLSLTSAGLGVRDPLVSGPFPLRDAIPILFAYAQGHAALAAIHVVLIGAFAITAFLRVRAALYTSECSPAAAGVTSAVR